MGTNEETLLTQLKSMTKVVVDSGDIEGSKEFKPVDATTNPTLLLKAAKLPQYKHLVDEALAHGDDVLDYLICNFGAEYLKHIPGRVSTEVDARLSFDTDATISKAKKLISIYEKLGVSKERILIKIAATWEGIKAAKYLEAEEGIHCNLTLLFCLTQAVACAQAKVTLVSPFVGRILDWNRKKWAKEYEAADDPGVESVKEIYNYFKYHGYSTTIMGASFRNIGEICELSGCDCLTISPTLLEELAGKRTKLVRKLSADSLYSIEKKLDYFSEDGVAFKSELKSNEMAHQLLSEGIKKFDQDAILLESWLKSLQ